MALPTTCDSVKGFPLDEGVAGLEVEEEGELPLESQLKNGLR
jgi:hypothetical protein